MESANYIEEVNQKLEKDAELEGKFLTLLFDKQLYAIPVCDVVQIVGMQAITEIPDSVDYIKGVINLRGSIIPVIDMRLRFGKGEGNYDERTSIIIVSNQENEIGFIVDEVDSVIDIANAQISEPPKLVEHANKSYLSGIANLDGKVVLLLNASELARES